ncbi:hypothetical protein N431DRAFT_488658, partial [Stipitochalara longipes BDJ]
MQGSGNKGQERKRRFHHKTKKGCKTCKIRKVKCDESRPICQRCLKFGLGCDGYNDDHKTIQQKTKFSHGQVFPKRHSGVVVPRIQFPSTSVCRSPQQSLFSNQQEARYFQVFSTHTASQLTGLFASNLWSRLVLQVCESNASIRHAVIAIGALDPKTWRRPAESNEETSRRQFAYHEYSIAIRNMRKTTMETLDLRTRLMACLLFICFEIYHCNKTSAVAQIKSMSSLLEASCQQTTSILHAVDDELLESFQELEVQALVQNCYGKDMIGTQQRLSCRQTMRAKIPLHFDSMRQARSMFHILAMRQLHWQGTSRYGWPWYLATQTMGSMTDPPPNEWTSNEEWCLERDRRFEEYTAWSNAFQSLLLAARASNNPGEIRRANVLRMTYLYTYLSLMTRMLSPQESYYGQTSRLTELTDLLKSLLETGSNDSGFSMECNFLVPLSVVSYQFRHRALRQEAIKLLLAYPRREGLWDGVLIAKYSQWLAEIEEEDLGDEEYVPHDLAAGLVTADHNPIRKMVKLVAFKKMRSPEVKM